MATLLTMISLMILTIYTVVMMHKVHGIPYSLSETYYRLSHKHWYGISMSLAGVNYMCAAWMAMPEGCRILALISMVGMLMIAVSPNFKEKDDALIHYIGSVALIISTQWCVAILTPWLLLLWLLPTAYIIYYINKNGLSEIIESRPVFWLEVTAIVITYTNLILQL